MKILFQEIIFRPILNLLILFYSLTKDLGISIILSTLLIKIFLLPVTFKIYRSQRKMDGKLKIFRKKFKEIQKRYKDDPQRFQRETRNLLKEIKINPFGNLLFLILQIIVLIGFWQVLGAIFRSNTSLPLYSFVKLPSPVSYDFFGIFDLSKPNFFLAILVGLSQYFFSKTILKGGKFQGPQKKIQRFTTYFTPTLLFFFALSFPSGLTLALISLNIFSAFEQKLKFLKGAFNAPNEKN